MKMYERHPISADFPELSRDRLDLIVDSMRRRGYDHAEPIMLYEGRILDGWNRQRAASIAGVTPLYDNFEGTIEQAVDFSLDKNTARRHLTRGQEVYALLTVNQQLPPDRYLSDQAILKRTGASASMLAKAKQTWLVAPERAAAVGRGEASVETVEREEGVHDVYKRTATSGERAFALKTRLAARFDKARDLHPKRLPPQSALNEAVTLWAQVCEAAEPVRVEFDDNGKLVVKKDSV